MNKHYVILGAGIAGFTAAKRIRELDAEASITMLTAEKELPYLRPLLSKTWMRSFRSSAALLASADWYEQQKIEIRRGCIVEKILTDSRQILLAGGEYLPYDKCIYALGAESLVPSIPGISAPEQPYTENILTLRNAADFDRIRRKAATAHEVIVVGGGVVGMETAWELSQMDLEVTVLESADHILARQLDAESAEYFTQIAASHHVQCLSGVTVSAFSAGAADCRCPAIHLADGRILEADLVVLSCGIRPSIAVAQASGIDCRRGILTDDYLRTSAPDIYAAGDCIEGSAPNPGLWTYALQSAYTAATNAVGTNTPAPFHPDNEPVIMNCMGCSIFSYKSTRVHLLGTVPIHSTRVHLLGTVPISRFEVNPHAGDQYAWEKLFYQDGKMCGAVLIGDLRRMNVLRAEIDAEVLG